HAIPMVPVGGIYYATPGGRGFPEANTPSTATVLDVMSLDLDWINHDDTCLTAAQRMTQRNIGLLPVKDSQTGLLRGVVTDRDLVIRVLARWLDPATTLVTTYLFCLLGWRVSSDFFLLFALKRLRQSCLSRMWPWCMKMRICRMLND